MQKYRVIILVSCDAFKRNTPIRLDKNKPVSHFDRISCLMNFSTICEERKREIDWSVLLVNGATANSMERIWWVIVQIAYGVSDAIRCRFSSLDLLFLSMSDNRDDDRAKEEQCNDIFTRDNEYLMPSVKIFVLRQNFRRETCIYTCIYSHKNKCIYWYTHYFTKFLSYNFLHNILLKRDNPSINYYTVNTFPNSRDLW